jgi:hypothetical protein
MSYLVLGLTSINHIHSLDSPGKATHPYSTIYSTTNGIKKNLNYSKYLLMPNDT